MPLAADKAAMRRLFAFFLLPALSLPLAGRWLNLHARLGDGPQRPSVQRLEVGHLVLPGWMAEPAVALALRWWDRPRDGGPPLLAMLQGTRWQAERATVVYRWQGDLPRRLAEIGRAHV